MSIGRALTGWAGYAAVALVGAVLAWTAQGWRADARLAKVEKDWGDERAVSSQLLAQAQDEARTESERRYQAMNEVRDEADQNLARVVVAERAAADERVRDAVADYARRHRAPARHPGATQSGPTSADPIGLLAELLGEADGMAEVYAAEADRARVAGWRASVHTMRCALPAASVGVEYCGHARPIYFDSAQQVDATPAGVRRQVLEGNETWRALCRH